MKSNKKKILGDLVKNLTLDDLKSIENELESAPPDVREREREKFGIIRRIIEQIEAGGEAREAVRDAVNESVKTAYEDLRFRAEGPDTGKQLALDANAVERKKQELYEMLDSLDEHMRGKSVQEVTALFSSLLEFQSQLCMQKTDGVITVKVRLFEFFRLPERTLPHRPELKQEISLIFTPEEVCAVQMRMPEAPEDDPLKPFFTTVLDQAYDAVQFNEMTGHLLLTISQYFIEKLANAGYGEHSLVAGFRQRHERTKMSLEKAVRELRELEALIGNHLRERPILVELPKYLRALIHIKIGLMDERYTHKYLDLTLSKCGEYARARGAVAFDFNRLPALQHALRLKQRNILGLQKDVIQFAGEMFEKEFRAVKSELDRMLEDIEAATAELNPNSPEFQELMERKAGLQRRLEESRRQLDVARCQERLVDVQHSMVNQAIKRYQENEASHRELEEKLKSRPKEKLQIGPRGPAQKKINRMVMARKMRGKE